MFFKKIVFAILFTSASLFALEVEDFIDKSKCDQIINKKTYSICYSYKYKGAVGGWTTINGEMAVKEGIKERMDFYDEVSLPEKYRTSHKDYNGYGKEWNRGHIIVSDAEADYSVESLWETYSMANIVPQSALVNQKTWTKAERYGRMVASKIGDLQSVTIVSYKNSSMSFNGITVPSDFYRIYYNNDKNFQRCFHYENTLDVDVKNDDLRNHEIDCNSLKI